MSQIHITDGQSDEILDVITANYIIEDTHRQSLKDNLELYEFKTFADQSFSEYLGKKNRVIIPNEDENGYIEFVINEYIKRRGSDGLICEVYASASYLMLKKSKVINPQRLEGQTASTMAHFALQGTEWQPGTITFAGSRTLNIEQHTNPFSLLKRIAREFNLELHFRIETDGNKVTGRYVDLLPRIGEWQGREIEIGKDLIGIERTEKTDQLVTALIGLGPVREDGTRLEVRVEDQEALQRWGRNGRHLIETYEPQSTREDMTLEELTQYTKTELNKRVNAVVEYKGDIADLEHVPGLENKKIRFGDTIRIKDTKFNPPLYLEARNHTQDRSITDKSKKHVELGDYIEYTEEEVNAIWQTLQEQIRQRITQYDLVNYTYDKTTIDGKDESVFQDSTYYADVVSLTAEERAKLHAEQKASEAEQNAKQEAIQYTDAEVEAQRQALMQEIATKAGLEYVNGQLMLKVDNSTVQAINNTVNNLVSVSDSLQQRVLDNEEAISQQGGQITSIVQEVDTVNGTLNLTIDQLTSIDNTIQSQQTQIQANAQAISLKANQADLNTLTNEVSTLSFQIEVQSGKIALKAEQSSLESLENDVTNVNNSLSSLVVDVDSISQNVSSLLQTVNGHTTQINSVNSSITQLSNEISQKVSQTEYTADKNGIVSRLDSAESTLVQQANQIQQRVTHTEVNNSISGALRYSDTRNDNRNPSWYWSNYPRRTIEEFKFRTVIGAPGSSTYGLLETIVPWSDSSGGPIIQTFMSNDGNYQRRSNSGTTWSSWIQIETTIGSQAKVDSLNTTEIVPLKTRVSTAESTITQHANQIALRVQKNNIISEINQTAESIKIQASRIELIGTVNIANGAITNAKIANATIESAKIKSLDASKINATTLSAISSNLGNVTAGTITQTGSVGSVVLDNQGFRKRDAEGNTRISINNENWNFQGASPSTIGFEPNSVMPFIIGTGLTGYGDAGIGFTGTQANRTFNLFNYHGSIGFHAKEIDVSADMILRDANGYTNHKGIELSGNHVISNHSGDFTFYGNRSSGSPFKVRSHANGSTFRDDILIESSGRIVFGGTIVNDNGNRWWGNSLEASYINSSGRTDTFIRPASNGEVKITANGTEGTYRPCRASSFPTGTSLRKNKTDIEVYKEDALSIIKSANAYLYRLKDDEISRQKQLGLMVDETPRLLHGEAGDSMEMYALNTFLWRGVQQLAEKSEHHEDEINWLKLENQSLRNRVRELELKIA